MAARSCQRALKANPGLQADLAAARPTATVAKGRVAFSRASVKTGTEKSAKRSVGEVDRKIGALIRIRRLEMEMSQATLAKAIGVTFQQIQKYERGANRIAAGTLIEIARTLEIEMSALLPAASSPNPALASLLEDAKMEELTRAWARLSEDGRCTLVGIAKALANEKRMTRKPR